MWKLLLLQLVACANAVPVETNSPEDTTFATSRLGSDDIDESVTQLREGQTDVLAQRAFMSSIRSSVETELEAILENKNVVFDEAVLPTLSQWLDLYTTLVSAMSTNSSLSTDVRWTAVADLSQHLINVASVISSRNMSSASVSRLLLDSITQCGTAFLAAPPSKNSGALAYNAANTHSLIRLTNTPNNITQNWTIQSNNIHNVSVNLTNVISTGNSSNIIVTVVNFATDALFPTTETVSTLQRLVDRVTALFIAVDTRPQVGSEVLVTSLSGASSSATCTHRHTCATFDYTVNLVGNATNATQCVQYDMDNEKWSRESCTMTWYNTSHATCCCIHHHSNTTISAVLVGGEDDSTTRKAQTFLTWVGFGLLLFFWVILLAAIMYCIHSPSEGKEAPFLAPGVSVSPEKLRNRTFEVSEPKEPFPKSSKMPVPGSHPSCLPRMNRTNVPNTHTPARATLGWVSWKHLSTPIGIPIPVVPTLDQTKNEPCVIHARVDHTVGRSGPILLHRDQIITAVTNRLSQLAKDSVDSGELSVDVGGATPGAAFQILATNNAMADAIRRALAAGVTVRIADCVYTIIAPRTTPSWSPTEGEFDFAAYPPGQWQEPGAIYEDDVFESSDVEPDADFLCTTKFTSQ